jgi:hypothetical protein
MSVSTTSGSARRERQRFASVVRARHYLDVGFDLE